MQSAVGPGASNLDSLGALHRDPQSMESSASDATAMSTTDLREASQISEEPTREVAQVAYPLPPGMDTNDTLKYIFQHCCTFGRASAAGTDETRIDNANFMKMVKKAPGLLTKRVTTQHVDVVFTKCKNRGERRLNYSRFLDALASLAAVRYPDEDPVTAFTYLLCRHIFGLLASKSGDGAGETTEQVRSELLSQPNLSDADLDVIRAQEEDEAMLKPPSSVLDPASYDTDYTQRQAERRTAGKILYAKKKWQAQKSTADRAMD